MNKVTYLIGAGFSAPLGLPVMSNFLAKSKDLFYSGDKRFVNFQRVFDQIRGLSYAKNYYKTDLMNIEEILSIQEMADFLEGRKLSSDFSQYIIDTIEALTPKLPTDSRPGNWHDWLFGLGGDVEKIGVFVTSLLGIAFSTRSDTRFPVIVHDSKVSTKYSVISLNYDMVFENYAQHLNATFDVHGIDRVEFRSDEYDPLWNKCHLAKLHGSVHSKQIVPPTWAKGTHPSIVTTWKNAYQILKDSNHIRFIGYSLPVADSYLKYLLKSAVVDTPHLKTIDVICLDWDGEVRKRYEDFFEFSSFRFKNASISEMARVIAEGTISQTRNHPNGDIHFRDAEAFYESFMRG